MCYFIGIEDLAVGALVELYERKQTSSIRFFAIEEYGNAVVRHLKVRDVEAVLILSRERTRSFIHDCSEFFEVTDPWSPNGTIALREGVSVDDLLDEFSGHMSLVVLEALSDAEVVDKLIKAA